MTLARSNRISSRSDIRQMFAKGDRQRISPIELIRVARSDSKACVIIPKRVEPSSVKRSRMRRQCSEVMRQSFQDNTVGHVMVRFIHKPNEQFSFSVLWQQYLDILNAS